MHNLLPISVLLIIIILILISIILNYRNTRNKFKQQRDEIDNKYKNLYNQFDALLIENNALKDELAFQKNNYEDTIVPNAIKKSREVNTGLAIEQLAPILSKYDSKDMIFIGKPFDYLVLVGLEKLRTGQTDKLEKIVLLEIKSNKSQLNSVQRKIKNQIHKLEFETMRIKEDV